MSELETTPSPLAASPDRAVQEELSALHRVIQLSLIALLVIGASLTIFLWRQQRELTRQVVLWQPYVEKYDKFLMPMIGTLAPGLSNYARAHPDLNEVLYKYGVLQPPPGRSSIGSAPPPSAPVVAPRAAPSPPKK